MKYLRTMLVAATAALSSTAALADATSDRGAVIIFDEGAEYSVDLVEFLDFVNDDHQPSIYFDEFDASASGPKLVFFPNHQAILDADLSDIPDVSRALILSLGTALDGGISFFSEADGRGNSACFHTNWVENGIHYFVVDRYASGQMIGGCVGEIMPAVLSALKIPYEAINFQR